MAHVGRAFDLDLIANEPLFLLCPPDARLKARNLKPAKLLINGLENVTFTGGQL